MSSNLVEIIQRYGVEYIGRFYSVYRGVVTNNKDDTGMNRLSLYIPSIQNGINVIALPKSTSFGSINYGIKLITPRIGEVVYVEFEMVTHLNHCGLIMVGQLEKPQMI